MTKKNMKKLLIPHSAINAAELTACEKKELYAMLDTYGMSQSTAHLRIFDKGLDEWELRGVDTIKREFCDKNALNHLRNTGVGFYSALTPTPGMKTALINQMVVLGMEHRNTISRRFDTDDWKPWERRGIRDLITELCAMGNQL